MSYIDGLASGLDTTSLIQQLMQIERQPQVRLNARRAATENIASTFGTIRSDVAKLRSLAADLRTVGSFQGLKATASTNDVVVTARSGSVTGSLDLRVDQLATAKAIYSNETVASMDSVVLHEAGTGYTFDGIGALGFASMSARSGAVIADGTPITVTQSSAAAAVTATDAPTTPLTITTGSNDELRFSLNGVDRVVRLSAGTYSDVGALTEAVNTAISQGGLAGEVRADVSGGRIRLSTVNEGSAMTLQVKNSNGRAALGFSVGTTGTGVDGIVSFNGVTTTVTNTTPGTTVDMGGGVPPLLAATLSGGLRTGEAHVRTIDLGDGTLADVVRAINTATGLGYRAAAVNVGTGYRLQLTATETGAQSAVTIDQSEFIFSGFTTLTEGQDAKVTVAGENPYSITSSSNTLTDLLPGLDVTLVRPTTDPVRVEVQHDLEGRADKVKSLVDEVNAILKRLADASKADPNAANRGPLAGNSELRRTRQDLVNALGHEVDPVTGSVGGIGIMMQRDGTIGFDRDKFLKVAAEDPDKLQALFVGDVANANDGVLDRLVVAANAASAAASGYLKTAEDGARRRISDMTRQIDVLERRVTLREQQYRRMFASLETSLGGLKNQSGWLTAQLG